MTEVMLSFFYPYVSLGWWKAQILLTLILHYNVWLPREGDL